MPVLAVNVDHVATLRRQRHASYPDPLAAAREAERAGAQCIIAHLREDRRHIQDADIERLAANITTRLNMEMAATQEMQTIALRILPYIVCLVPEKREELTTEGGLAVAGRETELQDFLAPLKEKGVKSSLFIEADPKQVDAAKTVGSDYIELHTGHYADAAPGDAQDAELRKILAAIRHAHDIGVAVNLGHGLDYDNIHAFSETPGVSEYSIGFSIVAQAVFVGMHEAVRQMWDIVRTFPE